MFYTEVASAIGAWTCPLALPAVPFEDVQTVLADLARTEDWPVNAFAYGDVDEPVTELLLYRDPSKSFGTPPVRHCVRAVRQLVAATGWTAAPERAPRSGLVVGIGLREGYDEGAVQHAPAEVSERLGEGATCRSARLLSARLVDDDVRPYVEDGTVVCVEGQLLPVVAELAYGMAQQRFAVTDLDHDQVYALARAA